MENYLHEAGLISNPPSGTEYQNGNGEKVQNFGVHEHWNNSVDKQYSRNLGKDGGIEFDIYECFTYNVSVIRKIYDFLVALIFLWNG